MWLDRVRALLLAADVFEQEVELVAQRVELLLVRDQFAAEGVDGAFEHGEPRLEFDAIGGHGAITGDASSFRNCCGRLRADAVRRGEPPRRRVAFPAAFAAGAEHDAARAMTTAAERTVTVDGTSYAYRHQSRHAAETYVITSPLATTDASLLDRLVLAVLQQARPELSVQATNGRIVVAGSGWDIFFEFTSVAGEVVRRAY